MNQPLRFWILFLCVCSLFPLLAQEKTSSLEPYIVVLDPHQVPLNLDPELVEKITEELLIQCGSHLGMVEHFYHSALTGFCAFLETRQVEELRRDPYVSFIEPDGKVYKSITQSNATWGLDRIDQSNLPLNSQYTYPTTATGVHVYVIDTGIRISHNEFAGRAVIGIDTVGDGQNGNDCDGHGTHVAGTIGGTLYGVAKGVTLHAVRVLDCEGSGFNSDVIAGIDWVTANKIHPAVANMSLGGSPSNALDTAVRNSINSGIVYAVAAGNSNASACNESPARVAEALTVGSTASNDRRSSFSNKGSCVDLFAPGSSITSAGIASNSATNVFSGTSMASPHVAGVAALYRAQNPNATPTQVANALITNATPNVLSSLGTGSPNLLLKVVVGSTDPEPEPDPEPDPDPTPTPILYQGKLKNTGAFQIQPGGTYYTTTTAGLHQGTLQGPVNTDFDLYLYRWNGSSWQEVAYSVGDRKSVV